MYVSAKHNDFASLGDAHCKQPVFVLCLANDTWCMVLTVYGDIEGAGLIVISSLRPIITGLWYLFSQRYSTLEATPKIINHRYYLLG